MASAPPSQCFQRRLTAVQGRNNNSLRALAVFAKWSFRNRAIVPRSAKEAQKSSETLRLSLVHLLDNPLPHRMRIPHQHPDVPMTADRSDLGRGQAHLEEAANGLVAKVMEVQVWTAGSACALTGTVTQNGHYLAAFE